MRNTLRKNIAILIIFLLAINRITGQVESLENKLKPLEGEKKFEMLLTISKEYWYSNPLKSVEYAQQALKLATEIGDDILKAKALNRIANGYYFLAQYKLALEYYLKSLDLSETRNFTEGIANATNNIGLIYQVMGDYDMAIEYYHKSLEIQKRKNDKQGIANASLNIGNIYYLIKNYKKALYYFYQSLSLFDELKNEDGELDVYNSIGSTYADLNDPDSALLFFEKALALSVKFNNLDKQASSMNNIGIAYFDKKDYKKALEYYNAALQIELGQDDLWLQANTIRNIGEVYFRINKLDKSIDYFTRAAEIARNIGAKKLLMDVYYDLSKYWEVKKNYEKSLEYFKWSTAIKDSIYNESSISQIAEFEAKYTLRNKDQQLQMVTNENKLQELRIKSQKYFIYIFASLSIAILALFLVFYTRARVNKKAKRILEAKNIHITEQKILLEKAIAELKESEEKHVSLIKNIQDGIFVIQDNKIRFANDSFCKITGYTLEEILDMDFIELIHPDDKERLTTNYRKRLAGEKVPNSYEFKSLHKSGKAVPVSISVGVINYLGVPAHIGTIKDISTLKKHESELIKQKERAEQATQSKSLFLAGMSHEIRNHMHSIIGISEIIGDTQLTAEQREYFNIINHSGNELMNIINEILDFSKIEAGQVVLESIEINIQDIITKVLSMHELQAKQAGIYLKAEIDDSLPQLLLGDPGRLSQILINLVSNAIKFTDEGGVTIKVSRVAANNSPIKPGAIACNVRFEVKDTGVGISEESQQKLFKPFSQTHAAVQRKKGGTGLGLAICKQLIDIMDGEIGVSSHPGKGSNFWFSLMMPIPEMIMITNISKTEGEPILKKRRTRIIVVEDNLLNQQLTVNILVKEGYPVDMAENGKIGLEMYKKNPYDVVLMDIQMPVMDGIQATRLIRDYERKNKLKKSIIVAVTAHAKDGERQSLLDAGMNDYLSKPFKKTDLIQMIGSLDLPSGARD